MIATMSDNTVKKYIIEEDNDECIEEIKQKGEKWTHEMLKTELTLTKPGSISHLLYGEKPSEQSINIKFGRLGEYLAKEIIKTRPYLNLLTCGVQKINDKKKDVDLIWIDDGNKIIYYRELKGNIELDTEKLPATINKCKEIETSLKEKYIDYKIDCGILNWSVYNREILTAGLSNIKAFETGGVKIDHMGDFLNCVNVLWKKEDFYMYFRNLGNIIKTCFH
jgi:hypothetical protein